MPISFRCPHCGHQTEVARQYVGQSGPCARCGQTITVVEEAAEALIQPPARRRMGTRGVLLLVGGIVLGVLALCGGGIGLMIWGVNEAELAAARTEDTASLESLGFAISRYQTDNGTAPAGTAGPEEMDPERQLSWLAELLPYLHEHYVYSQLDFDEAWDRGGNWSAVNTTLYDVQSAHSDFYWDNKTYFVGVGGVGLDAPTLPVTHARAGFFGYNRATADKHVTDGLSNTMIVAETHSNNGPWAQGGTATIRALNPQRPPYIGEGAQFGTSRGVLVLLGDGSVRSLEPETDAKVLEAMATICGNERVGF